jgi:hypothetical protein
MDKWLYSISDHCFDDLTKLQAELLFLDSLWHRFCFRSQTLHTFIFCRQSYAFTSVPAYVPRGNSGQNVDYY